MSYRQLLVAALIAGLPEVGHAQFTTFIPPKSKAADSAKVVAAVQQKAQADSVARTQLTNMKTWVDSAAGVLPTPASSAAVDSAAMTVPPTPSTPPATSPANAPPPQTAVTPDTAAFRNGATAPSTATSLPLLLVVGGLMVFTGAVLAGAKPTSALVNASRDRHDERA